MGGQVSTGAELFAFRVAKHDYELLSRTGIPDDELSTHLQEVFITAQIDYGYESFMNCKEPSSILVKISDISNGDPVSVSKTIVLEALMAQEKSKKGPVAEADYSKGFSGSAADTKAEKEFEKMMREAGGDEEDDEYAQFPVLRPPRIKYHEQHMALRAAGVWCRVLSKSGCYMYCHSLTRAIVSIRPEEYEDEDEVRGGEEGKVEEEKDPANGLPSCHITQLPAKLDELRQSGGKTPLILDGTPGHMTLTFFSMKAMLEDVSGLVVPYATSGVKRTDVMEKCRVRLVGALKSGSTFVLYLGGVTEEHADFKKKLCKKDTFPADVFQEWGHKLLGPKSNPRYKLLYREEDMDSGTGDAIARDDFKFICISSLSPYEYEEKLQESLPLGYMTALYVHNNDV
jgi:hypothetical protein